MQPAPLHEQVRNPGATHARNAPSVAVLPHVQPGYGEGEIPSFQTIWETLAPLLNVGERHKMELQGAFFAFFSPLSTSEMKIEEPVST